MDTKRPRIGCACERYACRVCRTKTGWPHQLWCELAAVTEPSCGECRYWSAAKGACAHPATKRR